MLETLRGDYGAVWHTALVSIQSVRSMVRFITGCPIWDPDPSYEKKAQIRIRPSRKNNRIRPPTKTRIRIRPSHSLIEMEMLTIKTK